jgi:hypothetical protein
MPTEKLIICEILFCELATRSVNIVTEMPIADNSIRYLPVINRNHVTEEHLKIGTFEKNPEQQAII